MRRLKRTTKGTLRFTDALPADGSLPTRSSRINDEQVRGKSQKIKSIKSVILPKLANHPSINLHLFHLPPPPPLSTIKWSVDIRNAKTGTRDNNFFFTRINVYIFPISTWWRMIFRKWGIRKVTKKRKDLAISLHTHQFDFIRQLRYSIRYSKKKINK